MWPHLVALAVVLLGVGALVLPGVAFTPDEGAYGAQADALAEGRWEYRTPADDVVGLDHEYAIFDGAPYTRHPAYPWLLRASMAVTGRGAGLVAVGVLGTAVAAMAAWWLAGRLRPGAEPYAFWLAAASPLLFDGFVVWSHPLAAAAFGLALVAVARGLEGRRWSWALAGGALVALVLLRSEGLFFGGGLAVALVAHGWRQRSAPIARAGLALGATAAATFGLERLWVRAIIDGADPHLAVRTEVGTNDPGYVAGRVEGFWRALLDGALYRGAADLIGVAGLALAAASVLAWTRRPAEAQRLLVAAGALYVVRGVGFADDPVPGLLAAWPIAVVALLGARRLVERTPIALVATIAVAVGSVAVLATQYPDGGGPQWGGRFFLPLVLVLAPFAAAAIHERTEVDGRRVAFAAVGVLAVVPTLVGVLVLRQTRTEHEAVYAAVRDTGADLVVVQPQPVADGLWRERDLPLLNVPQRDLGEAVAMATGAEAVQRLTLVVVPGRAPEAPGWVVTGTTRLAYDARWVEVRVLERA